MITELDPKHVDHTQTVRRLSIKRIFVLLSGAFANLLVAIVLFSLVGNMQGLPIYEINNPGLVAEGVTREFVLRHINDYRVYSQRDVADLLIYNDLNVLIFRNVNTREVTIANVYHINGIQFNDSIPGRIQSSFAFLHEWMRSLQGSVINLFTGNTRLFENAFFNPYSSITEMQLTFRYQFSIFLVSTGIISMALSYFNLLPFVIFDGYKVIVNIVPAVRNKKNGKKLSYILLAMGVVISIIMVV